MNRITRNMVNFQSIVFVILLATDYGIGESNIQPNSVCGNVSSPIIIGGKTAPTGVFPFVASLRYHGKHTCAGSIINDRWVLTAAHCTLLIPQDELEIYVGSNKLNVSGKTYRSERFVRHYNYSRATRYNDIALIKVNQIIKFNEFIKSVPLPVSEINDVYPTIVAGWGRLGESKEISNELKYIDVCLLKRKSCTDNADLAIAHTQVCGVSPINQGACYEDGGSPMIVNRTLVAIMSYINNKCGQGSPDVYTYVLKYLDWIKYIITIYS